VAYGVTQRISEIGIRVALGAERASIVWLVMRQGLMLASLGLVVGVALSLSLTKLMSTLLYDTPATDATTFVLVAMTLIAITGIAIALPARRACVINLT